MNLMREIEPKRNVLKEGKRKRKWSIVLLK